MSTQRRTRSTIPPNVRRGDFVYARSHTKRDQDEEWYRQLRQTAEHIRTNTDLVALVWQDTSLYRAGPNEWRGCNPFTKGNNPTAMRVYWNGTAWRWETFTGDKRSGDVIDYVCQRDNLSFYEAVQRLQPGMATLPSKPRLPVEVAPPPIAPLSWAIVERHQRLLDLPLDPTGRNPQTGRDWWHQQGIHDAMIERFHLGIDMACPTVGEDYPHKQSATIPIIYGDQVLGIRHRLIFPFDSKDKYRPHRIGQGMFLFNRDSLTSSDEVLILEGEKKVIVAEQFGLGGVFGVLSATGGITSWLRRYTPIWVPYFAEKSRVYVLFDPGAEDQSERTAWLFGRRGYMLHLPEKVDDYLIRHDSAGLQMLLEQCQSVRPVRSVSYWYAATLSR